MRAGFLPTEICIRDVSTRGLLLQCANAPPPGTIVEICAGRHIIMGRVRWAQDRRFGIVTGSPLNLGDLLSSGGNHAPTSRSAIHERGAGARLRTRTSAPDPEKGRQASARLQWAVMVVVIAGWSIWMTMSLQAQAQKTSNELVQALHSGR
ncbi:MAG: hypothetical protein H0W74_10515 [Sphingosinicella sp.]|nr:hypothetical protein [Sphingosinicella sp.]